MRVQTLIANTLLAAAVASVGCGGRLAYNLPPAQRLIQPGPGVGGPGPGVIPVAGTSAAPGPAAQYGPGGTPPVRIGGVQQCQYCEDGSCQGGACFGGGVGVPAAGPTSQIQFVGAEGLTIAWDVSGAGTFDSAPLFVPGRQDFPQAAIYRLKLTNIAGRADLTLYPTLEVAAVTPRTDAFLAHSAVPVQFTEEDFDQVVSGNFVTKVIYLPDPEFQELALSGVETLVSTRLDPGVDPVSEADRRGSILAVLRMGSKDLEAAGGNYQGGVLPAAYGENSPAATPVGFSHGGPVHGGPVPVGAPTAGFGPPNLPPHLIAGGPQYGLPHTGTPIGLPGPPHIPLGAPAGLRKHVIHNRTRVNLPPPTPAVKISVKHRPGINYPAPVNKVHIDEVNRGQVFGGGGHLGAGLRTLHNGAACETCN